MQGKHSLLMVFLLAAGISGMAAIPLFRPAKGKPSSQADWTENDDDTTAEEAKPKAKPEPTKTAAAPQKKKMRWAGGDTTTVVTPKGGNGSAGSSSSDSGQQSASNTRSRGSRKGGKDEMIDVTFYSPTGIPQSSRRMTRAEFDKLKEYYKVR
jgi:hypothetical protein